MKKIKNMSLKSKLVVVVGFAAVVVIGYFGMGYYHTYKAEQMVAQHPEQAVLKATTIKDSDWNLHLDSTSSEEAVENIMHQMTHQKVIADQKWGAIPMIPDTINQVYKVVKDSDFPDKDDLMSMLEDWKAGNFSHAASNHNYLWERLGGTVGEAMGIASPEEEAEYVLENFSSKVK
ncbi:DUF6241 domain-containing protein [Neobacillus cucumis]|uniref:DUF6241 domain-containing protein n=1 Tax=Neobacillus cucumis TaxID=1740721 RepID=UPI0028532E8B|nr:DUF6241 domain-containing protein [Neobacillus cucumis]MDR4945773.1 DUF6241 domain-containing protein [Neobacillus cucumis]